MKRLGRCVILFCVMAVLLTGTASANSAAPDYRVAVKVVNGPEDVYYLDLLEESGGKIETYQLEGMDQGLLEAMKDAIPDGWKPCTTSMSQWEDHFSGDLAGEDGVHVFHGYHTPKVFRIIIVTKSGESWVSNELERKVMQSQVTVDWEAKTASIMPKWAAFGMQLLSTLIPTLVIEGLLLLAFGLASKRNWLVFLAVNLVTQTALSAFLANELLQSGFYALRIYLVIMIPVEIVIALVEANVYKRLMREVSKRRTFWYGITANAASYILGWAAVEVVFAELVSL